MCVCIWHGKYSHMDSDSDISPALIDQIITTVLACSNYSASKNKILGQKVLLFEQGKFYYP